MNKIKIAPKIVIYNVDPETKAALERVRTMNGYRNFAGALKHVMDFYTVYDKAKEKE